MLKRLFREREKAWAEAEALSKQYQRTFKTMPAHQIQQLGMLYRSVMTDLSRARSDPQYTHLIPFLNQLAQKLHTIVYEDPPADWRSLARFFTRTFPQVFCRHGGMFLLATGLFFLGALVGAGLVQFDPATATYFLPDTMLIDLEKGILWTDKANGALHQSSFLMANNIMVALKAYAGGILLGIGTLFVLFLNGFSLGGTLHVTSLYGLSDDLFLFMIAHGVIELSTIFIAGAAGMLIGFALLFPGDLPRWEAVRQKSKDSLTLILGCIPLLVIAGLIEGMFSLNHNVPGIFRLAVGGVTGLFLYGYLVAFGLRANRLSA